MMTLANIPMTDHIYRRCDGRNAPDVRVFRITIDSDGRDLIWYTFTNDPVRRINHIGVWEFADIYTLA